MPQQLLVLWNSQAGSNRQYRHLCDELAARPDVLLIETSSIDEARQAAAQSSADDVALVAAAGGDGTVNAVVRGLLQNRNPPPLAILPLGTANDFCRTLAIPADPVEAAGLLGSGEVREIDVIRAGFEEGERIFINMATGGNTGRALESVTPEMKQFWGPLCYLRGAAAVVSELATYELTIECDGERPECYAALNVIVANGRTSGSGLVAAPDANPEDGLLDLVIILDSPPLDIAVMTAQLLLSDYLQNENIVLKKVRRLKVDSQPPMPFTADGEELTDKRVTFDVQPKALKVVVGPSYAAQPGD